ncbi:MAG: alpha/beta hydrolase [Clostridia bacterium]|nr:alpha/beta hydrolase [Clostridia bacterium]
MNKIYIVHCWDGSKDDGWYPWLDKKLSNEINVVYRFNMPNTDNPRIEEWVAFLDKQVDSLDDKTYFVGHSIGCQTIMRYLQTKNVCEIGGILFVAPWLDLLDYAVEDEESYNIAKPWLTEDIDFEKIKKFTSNINCIFSDDDYFVPLEQKNQFQKLLNANTIVVSGKGHISQDDEVYELKEIFDECNKMIE